MAENIVHEFRVIETDDGFRIEVKGDKERLKEMGFGTGMMGFGPRMFFGPRRHGSHRKIQIRPRSWPLGLVGSMGQWTGRKGQPGESV